MSEDKKDDLSFQKKFSEETALPQTGESEPKEQSIIEENSTENKDSKPKKEKSKQKKLKQKGSGWKIAFLTLVAILIGGTAFIGSRVLDTREANFKPSETVAPGEPTFQVNLKKAQVNQVIDYYLDEFLSNSKVKYSFYLENVALLNGTFKVLGHDVEFYLYFDPYVLENGNVQLKAKSLSIGTLNLPMKEIFKYVQKNYKLPDWVQVDADKYTAILDLNHFKLQNGMYLRAERINLIDDEVRINVFLPNVNKTSQSTAESTSTSE